MPETSTAEAADELLVERLAVAALVTSFGELPARADAVEMRTRLPEVHVRLLAPRVRLRLVVVAALGDRGESVLLVFALRCGGSRELVLSIGVLHVVFVLVPVRVLFVPVVQLVAVLLGFHVCGVSTTSERVRALAVERLQMRPDQREPHRVAGQAEHVRLLLLGEASELQRSPAEDAVADASVLVCGFELVLRLRERGEELVHVAAELDLLEEVAVEPRQLPYRAFWPAQLEPLDQAVDARLRVLVGAWRELHRLHLRHGLEGFAAQVAPVLRAHARLLLFLASSKVHLHNVAVGFQAHLSIASVPCRQLRVDGVLRLVDVHLRHGCTSASASASARAAA